MMNKVEGSGQTNKYAKKGFIKQGIDTRKEQLQSLRRMRTFQYGVILRSNWENGGSRSGDERLE